MSKIRWSLGVAHARIRVSVIVPYDKRFFDALSASQSRLLSAI